MVIKRLVMHNFGVYASTNQFDFLSEKPVVLIGGMNGRGKTTFLEAVLLGLYGSNSSAYTESQYKSYGQYLKSFVNKSDGSMETYIEIEFSMGGSAEEIYCVHREWNAKKKTVKEHIWVKRNGEESAFLTENWPMFVESILPSALSSFFFFDGEKIAELAVDNTSEQMKESIKAMLGISVLDHLESDLGRIVNKTTKRIENNQNLLLLEKLREEKERAQNELKETDEKIEKIEKDLLIKENMLEKKRTEYSVKGGEIVEQRQKLLEQKAEAVASVNTCQELLLDLAGGELPLVLVQSLLKEIQIQAEKEQESKITALAVRKLEDLYKEYEKITERTEEKRFLQYARTQFENNQIEEIYNLSAGSIYSIKKLNEEQLAESQRRALELIGARNKFQSRIDEVDNYLSVDIDETALQRISRKIQQIELEIMTEKKELEKLEKERKNRHGDAMAAESRFNKMAESVLTEIEGVDDDSRIVKYAHIATQIITEYRTCLQARKIDVLAENMTECYKKLANKKNLIEKIEMDAETLDLRYINSEYEEVDKQSLSAGEKQLMVISLLWALAICSKKKLPVIIDTPLSRLDSSHRTALITTYFPHASDQTIILSTDTEITEEYYKLMKENLGDEFTLDYNDSNKHTIITRGYFFSRGIKS